MYHVSTSKYRYSMLEKEEQLLNKQNFISTLSLSYLNKTNFSLNLNKIL
jgi:hypothetical protein